MNQTTLLFFLNVPISFERPLIIDINELSILSKQLTQRMVWYPTYAMFFVGVQPDLHGRATGEVCAADSLPGIPHTPLLPQ